MCQTIFYAMSIDALCASIFEENNTNPCEYHKISAINKKLCLLFSPHIVVFELSSVVDVQLYIIIVDTILVPHRPSCRSWSYNVRPQHQFSVRSTNGTYNLSFPLHISLYIYFLNVLEFNILPYFLFQHLKTTKLPFLLELNDLLKDRK
uniref:Uncharacterized protein n=1 Tax=Cacopsylla melanoneura TaxID=428564 RepID=A0A8D8X6V6_9HEMI